MKLNLKEDNIGCHNSEPVERLYIKYNPKNNLPTHEDLFSNHKDKNVKTLSDKIFATVIIAKHRTDMQLTDVNTPIFQPILDESYIKLIKQVCHINRLLMTRLYKKLLQKQNSILKS